MEEEKLKQIETSVQSAVDELSQHCTACLVMASIDDEDLKSVNPTHAFYWYSGGWHAALMLAREFERMGEQRFGNPDLRYKVNTITTALGDIADAAVVLAGIYEERRIPLRCFAYKGNWWRATGMAFEFIGMRHHDQVDEKRET